MREKAEEEELQVVSSFPCPLYASRIKASMVPLSICLRNASD